MKKLTKKFRDIFQMCDYNNIPYRVLSQLLDIIITMMTITDHDDANNIQKLASFLKIFSSEFCLDLMSEDMIDNIYENQILPIFVYFDEKYEHLEIDNKIEKLVEDDSMYYDTDEKKLCNNTDEETSELKSSEISEDSIADEISEIIYSDIPVIHNAQNIDYEIRVRGDPEQLAKDNKMLKMLESTSNRLIDIYGILPSINSSDTEIIDELQYIYNSIILFTSHENYRIKVAAIKMRNLCSAIINLIMLDYPPIYNNTEIQSTINRFIELLLHTYEK